MTNRFDNKQKSWMTWNWAGHIARMTDERWTKIIMTWRPQKELWADHQSEGSMAGTNWQQVSMECTKQTG